MASQEYDLDPMLIAAVIKVESNGHPAAISEAGAVGLMQVVSKSVYDDRLTARELLHPWLNVLEGSRILREKIDALGGIWGGLGAYYGCQDCGYQERVWRVWQGITRRSDA
jgi:soluble lytic murein transglycosylase-like protein